MCVAAADAGSITQSHLTREERVRDAAELEGEREVKKRRRDIASRKRGVSSVLNVKQHGIRRRQAEGYNVAKPNTSPLSFQT